MNTRAAIGLQDENGNILGIICHYDGYLNGVGRTLFAHYNTQSKILKLIELGTLAHLKSSIESTQNSNQHNFRHVAALKFKNLDDFERYYSIADYFYLFSSNEWKFRHRLIENTPYTRLEFALN